MCVNKEHYTCCCCSLTTATYILGVFQILGSVMLALTDQWATFAVSALTSLCYILICMDKHSVVYRKWLFQLVSLGMIINILCLIVVYFIYLFTDGWLVDACASATSWSS